MNNQSFTCQPYTSYKPSGIEWLGEVPKHWEVNRLKFFATINPVKSEVRSASGDLLVTFAPMEAVKEFGGLDTSEEKNKEEVYQGYTYFKEGDVLTAKITPCFENGKATIATGLKNGIGFGTTELHVLRAGNNLNNRFLFYMIISAPFLKVGESEMFGAGGQKRVPQEFIENWIWAFPPKEEQQTIATFLNHQTARIDRLIQKKKRLLELLDEQRQAIITRAVTKGLSTDAPMKDSGIEWLGKIPKHWKLQYLKYVSTVQSSNVDKKSKEGENDVLLCNYMDVYKNEYIDDTIAFMKATAPERQIEKFTLEEGDIIITKDSEDRFDIAVPAKVNMNLENVLCGYHLAQIRPKDRQVDSGFLFRWLQSDLVNDQFKVAANGITRYGLSVSSIKDSIVALPPIPEQKTIAAFLDQETSRIDQLKSKVQEAVVRLEEYRASLITQAVTGKIDVRSFARSPDAVASIAAETKTEYGRL